MNTTLYGFIKRANAGIAIQSLGEALLPALIGAGGGSVIGYLTGKDDNPRKREKGTRMRNAMIGGLLGGLGLGGYSTYLNMNGLYKDIEAAANGTNPLSPQAANAITMFQ